MIVVGGETVRETAAVSLSFGVAVHVTAAEYIGSNPVAGSRLKDLLRVPNHAD